MLGNHGIRQGGAARRHPEALLQERERQGLALLGLLQKSEHQLKGGHPHCDIQRLDHQAGCSITITTGQQVLPEVPPALVGKQVALVAAMEQGPRLGAQAVDQMLQINAPGPLLARGAIDAGQLADPVAAQIDNQPVMMQPHRDLAANQGGRHRVDHLPHLDRAGAPHPHRQQLVVGKAKSGQWCQPFELLLVAPLTRGIDGTEHLREQLAVFSRLVEIAAATQDQLLLQPPFHMAVRCLDDPVLMGHPAVVATGAQAVVSAERLVARGDVEGVAAVPVAAGGREPISAQFLGHPTAGSQGVLQALGEGHKALTAVNHLAVSPATPGQAVVQQQVREWFSPQGDLHPLDLGEITEADLTGLVRQREHHLRRRAMERLPLLHPPLQGAFH